MIFKTFPKVLIILFLIIICISCHTHSKLMDMTYFNQKKDSLIAQNVIKSKTIILPGDKLSIAVTALDPNSVAPFNFINSSNGIIPGYYVEADGNINFPQLGKIFVNGYSTQQVSDTLTFRLSKYVNNPLVNVQLLNYKVNVLGEVNSPGVKFLPEGKGTILDAIGLAGDLTFNGKSDNIIVIREKDNVREFGTVNLLSINVFNSPYYNLHQNDIIYVAPVKSDKNNNDQAFLKSISIFATVISVVTTLFFLVINISKL